MEFLSIFFPSELKAACADPGIPNDCLAGRPSTWGMHFLRNTQYYELGRQDDQLLALKVQEPGNPLSPRQTTMAGHPWRGYSAFPAVWLNLCQDSDLHDSGS